MDNWIHLLYLPFVYLLQSNKLSHPANDIFSLAALVKLKYWCRCYIRSDLATFFYVSTDITTVIIMRRDVLYIIFLMPILFPFNKAAKWGEFIHEFLLVSGAAVFYSAPSYLPLPGAAAPCPPPPAAARPGPPHRTPLAAASGFSF